MATAVRAVSIPSSRPLLCETFVRPEISLWRRDLISTHLTMTSNGFLTCDRPHPHPSCCGRFKLACQDIAALVAGWSDDPQLVVRLPTHGLMRCEAWRQPDGGLQLVRYDRRGKRCHDFRIFAADVAPFLFFCRRSLFVA